MTRMLSATCCARPQSARKAARKGRRVALVWCVAGDSPLTKVGAGGSAADGPKPTISSPAKLVGIELVSCR